MKKYLFILIFLIVPLGTSYSQIEATTKEGKKVVLYDDGTWAFAKEYTENLEARSILRLEIPKLKDTDEIINHYAFTLSYNEQYEQANWVAYELTSEETEPKYKRNNKFIPDPFVSGGSATNDDYKGSGYDRGHLAPAGDMAWSKTAMDESFFYSNMSPQLPSFNRGIWKKLEELVRDWAQQNDAIYVVTGPILEKNLDRLKGPHKVAVPKYYYKVILDFKEPEIKGIGFIIPNEKSDENLEIFAVTIDSVEKRTGIDFFPALSDNIENKIESSLKMGQWDFDHKD